MRRSATVISAILAFGLIVCLPLAGLGDVDDDGADDGDAVSSMLDDTIVPELPIEGTAASVTLAPAEQAARDTGREITSRIFRPPV
jgi:hypothetical protein